jgi:hypothetical protein
MSEAILNEIYDEIVNRNSLGNAKSIPHSDEFVTLLSASMGVSVDLVKTMIKVLSNSHKIFVIEIVAEDTVRSIPRVEGYVATDLALMRKMKSFFQKELVYMYNTQFNKDLMVHQVIKEIFPVIRSFNNTPLGEVANKAIMLEEFEKLVETSFIEYTEEWKEQQLAVEMEQVGVKKKKGARDEHEAKQEVSKSGETLVAEVKDGARFHLNRAVDSNRYKRFVSRSKSKSYPLKRILNIYGIRFFLQSHLRRYQFSYLTQIIEDNQITKRSDLMLLKDMLKSIKVNIERDPNLVKYKDDIYNLERTISHYIYFSDRGVKK